MANKLFYLEMLLDGNRYARGKSEVLLPNIVFETASLMLNEKSGFDMKYQTGKVHNLKLAEKTIDKVVIAPNEVFSFWQLVRWADQQEKYKEGLNLVNGKIIGSYGGGLCQLSNMLFWLFLHTPMTIVERHGHAVEWFPPTTEDLPCGTDATDVQAAFDGDPAAFNKDEIIFSYPRLFAVMVNRIAHELYLLNILLIPRIMTEYAHNATGIDIHPGATIGKYFFIDHGTGIVIGETAVIGENVKIYQGVTLGALSTRGGQKLKSQKRHPTIDDNVTIYSGASILGGETVVGKNVVVGGNTFITKSIPEGTRVSIKNQELRFNYDAAHPVQRAELEVDESWFYVI